MASNQVVIEILNNVRCRASNLADATAKYLDDSLAEEDEGAHWRRRGYGWDGKRHHFYRNKVDRTGTFPKGLLARVKQLLDDERVKYSLKDLRRNVLPPIDVDKIKPDLLNGVRLDGKFSYQLDAVKSALKAECGILHLATNAGKTECAAAMIKTLSKQMILFVVPKRALLSQTRERLATRLGMVPEAIGVIGGGQFRPEQITVAIINSVTPVRAKSARAKHRNKILYEYLEQVEVVFLDEGHHAKATTWFKLMNALRSAQYRYLLTGTPFGKDKRLLVEAAAGPVIARVSNKELAELGVSAVPTIRMIECNKPKLSDQADWHEVYKSGVVHNGYRNGLIVAEAIRLSYQDKPTLILVRELSQGAQLRQMLAGNVEQVEFAHGQMPTFVQDEIKARFVQKAGAVLIASSIFDEGVDIPDIRALIIADGGKSIRATLQKVGRSIRRKKTGTNTVEVIDFLDDTHKYLAKHSLERHSIYAGEEFNIVEEKPEILTERELRDARAKASGKKSAQALPREVNRSSQSIPPARQHAEAQDTASVCTRSVQASGTFLFWYWRQRTRLDRGSVRSV